MAPAADDGPGTTPSAPAAPARGQNAAAVPWTVDAPPPALAMAGIAKAYGASRVLTAIDLTLAAGDSLAVVGGNGTGKSTLLRIAAGLSRPTSGSLRLSGVDPRADPDAARRRVAVLTQEAPLYPELSPRDHLRWWARLHRAAPHGSRGAAGVGADAAGAADRLLAAAGLSGMADRPARHLSRGQRQRTCLAMALLPDAPLLVLDEPFAALDAEGEAWLAAELQARRGRQALLVAVHGEAHAALAARVAVLRAGRLEAA